MITIRVLMSKNKTIRFCFRSHRRVTVIVHTKPRPSCLRVQQKMSDIDTIVANYYRQKLRTQKGMSIYFYFPQTTWYKARNVPSTTFTLLVLSIIILLHKYNDRNTSIMIETQV